MKQSIENPTEKSSIDVIERLGGKELIGFHRTERLDIDAVQYLELYQKLLARGLSQVLKLYLDTKFWCLLRDADRNTNDEGIKLLELIRQLVRNKRLICIVQAASFLEIAKQSTGSLMVVSSLIDEFTESISIAPQEELQKLEAINYVRFKLNAQPISQHYVWTKIGLVLISDVVGHINKLLPKSLDKVQANILLKSVTDALWQARMEDILEAFNWDTAEKLSAVIDQSTIESIEDRKKCRVEENRSLLAIRKHEFETFIPSTYRQFFGQTVFQVARETREQIVVVDKLAEVEELISKAVKEGVNGELSQYMPNTVIQTNLYCLYEHDKKKKLSSNDWFDMCHASVALPYCDFFFTEKHLRHQLCNVLKFDKEYRCEVVSNIDTAINVLEQLA